jgi:hypothetical protein
MESSGVMAVRPKKRKATKTTSRGKASARIKIKIRKRVKICRSQLFHNLSTDGQRASIPDDAKLDDVAMASDEDVRSPEKAGKISAEDNFCKQPRKDIAEAGLYTMRWGSGDEDVIDWKILKDCEIFSLDNDVFLPDKVGYSDNLTEEDLDDPTDFFFKFVFPDITGTFNITMFVLSQFLFDLFLIINFFFSIRAC